LKNIKAKHGSIVVDRQALWQGSMQSSETTHLHRGGWERVSHRPRLSGLWKNPSQQYPNFSLAKKVGHDKKTLGLWMKHYI
jgi:hypothetical protein